jgi:hypothetical protein
MLIRSTLIGILVLATGALAQPPEPGRGPGRGPGPFGGARFLGAEAGMPGRVVKNAPYSADIVTETTQTLPDGNRIHQVNTVRFYRDSEGRTRSEQSLKTLNGLAPNSNLPPVVFINDPVAGSNYALNPTAKTATRSNWARPGGEMRPMGRGPGAGPGAEIAGPGPGRGLRRNGNNIKTEALGSQTIEGVPAEGTRTTMTIPAGEIGNDQALQIVSETWRSADLKTIVLYKRSDPRTGETVTRMTNVSRAEPPSTLFQVPVDFKVSDSPRTGRGPRQ